MKKIYILSEKKFEGAVNLPLIKINFFNLKIDLKEYDTLIFTSKNGVEAIDKIDKNWKNKEIYSIGLGTTKTISDKNVTVSYTAKSSYGDDFAKEILPFLKDKKVLFPRAKKITSKLGTILKENNINLDEKIVYETVCNYKTIEKPKENSVIIFSSPSTIKCFFEKFSWDSTYKAIVIGSKTASFMPKNIKFYSSKTQTIPACIKLAEKLL